MAIVTELVEHLPRLRRYARALTGDRFASEDLVQDTVERALSRFTFFRRGSRMDAWLLAIMHNVFISQKRHQSRRPADESLDERVVDPAVRGTESDGLEIRDLDRALGQLPVEQRQVLLLVSLEEFSYEETAAILGIPLGTVMSRLSRGRERLRLILSAREQAADAITHLKVIK
jgi:RNA polymerase sigma-70 factor (ECF subfamily)